MAEMKHLLKEITHISIVVKNLDETIKKYWEELGIGPWKVFKFAPPRLTETYFRGKPAKFAMKVALADVGSTGIEVIQPLEGVSAYSEFLKERGEGIHHIACFKFDSLNELQAVIAEFKKKGIDILQCGRIEHTTFYYLDTEKIYGFIYEVTYAPPPPLKPDYIYP